MLDIIINPFITILLFLYQILGGNVVLAIVVFTILVRLATFPLTMRQQRSTKAMQELQPELKRLQEKYKNDRERLAQEQWELYREHGVNPLASCLPMLVQLPILLGLYRAIVATLAATPFQLLNLSGRLWVPELSSQVPLQNKFLWLNLAVPDPMYILPILVVATTFLQQRLLMPPTPPDNNGGSGDATADQAANMSRQMMMIMPLMFGFFSLSFASGLSIYFIASNFIGIGQYAMMGKIDVKAALGLKPAEEAQADAPAGGSGTTNRTTSRAATTGDTATTAAPRKPKSKRSGISDSRVDRARLKR